MEAARLFLIPIFKERICSHLNFEEIIRFRDALGLPSLKCPIFVIDPQTGKKIILPGVNSATIAAYYLIKQNNLNLAFIMAAANGQNSVVQTLIAARADLEAVDQSRCTALIKASENGHKFVVQTLVNHKVNIEAVNKFGLTALLKAAVNGRDSVVKNLIEAKANVEAVDFFGYSAYFNTRK